MAIVTQPGGSARGPWLALANLGAGVSVLGGGFFPACECRMNGDDLQFRGNLALTTDSGGGFRVFDLPAAIVDPAAIRRLFVESGTTGMVPLNFNTDGTVTLSVTNPSSFIILDGQSIPGWT